MKSALNTFTSFLFTVLLLFPATIPGFAQRLSSSAVNGSLYIYLGKDDVSLHLVWEEHPAVRIERYVIEKSYDGNVFFAIDSILPVTLFDIHVNNYPDNIDYYDRILYSTETGAGRFIYNDVRGVDEAGEKNFWYRIKMVKPNGDRIFTKTVVQSFQFGIADIDRLREVGGAGGNQRGGGLLLGDGDGGQRGSGPCPNVQTPPSGYIFNGGIRTFYGDCCYWEEREYVTQQITEACNGIQSWCCPRDCSPLAYDPCCYHICNEYNQCSCHPWTCCDVASGAIWIVTASTTYAIGASVAATENPACVGNFDGSVTINNLDGIQPITYFWDNGTRTGSILNQLAAGVYNLTVTDANGCSETVSFNIVDPPALTSSFTTGDVSCFGFNDGFVDVSVSGGTQPYTYTWTGGSSNGATTQDLTNIGSGNYALTITDANNCVSNLFTPVFSPDTFTGVVSFLDLSCLNAGSAVLELCCYGTNTGSAVLTLSGGTPPNTFIWSNGATTPINTDLTSGTYAVTAVDANGCSFTASSTLGEPDEIIVSVATTNAACGQCNGTASLIVDGGSGLFDFTWPTSAGSQTTPNVTGLCAGTYSVTVSDAFAVNCTKTITVSISNDGGELITTTHTDASCAGACNGTSTVNFACSTPPCSVEWFAPSGALLGQSNTVSNLCAGSYSVVVTNGVGCITAETVDISEGDAITVNLSVTHESCPSACDGTATATPAGGSVPYTYQWQDSLGNPLPLPGNASAANLCPGSYRLLVADAAGCSATQQFIIFQNIFSIATTETNLLCNGVCTGSITADVSGGTGPFSYQWLDAGSNPIAGAINSTVLNLCSGTYFAQVTTSTGCTLTSPPVQLTEPDAITTTLNASDIPCAGQCIGSASVISGGGIGAHTYQWYDAANVALTGETNPSVSNLCEGTYSVVITDSNGCATDPQPAVIAVLTTIDIVMAPENISCNNANDGSINITVNGGASPLTFDWNNGSYSDQNIFNLTEGTYTVVVTDATGCTATNSAYIVNPGELTVSASPYIYPNSAHVSCYNGTNGRATVAAAGGTAPYNYLWSDSQQAPIAIGLSLGTYTVTVTDASGCSAITDVTLHLNPSPMLTTLVADTFIGGWNVSCFGASDGFIDLTVTNGTPPFVYSWQPGNIVFIEDLQNTSAVTYTVIVTDTVNGCSVSDSITLTEPPALSGQFNATNVSCLGGHDGAIDVTISGGTPGYSFAWDNGSSSEDISGISAGIYTLNITDTNGCVFTDSALVAEPADIPVGNISISTCRDSFFVEGAYQTTSGLYYDTVQYGAGCDSLVITDLQFVSSFLVPDTASMCEGSAYFIGGMWQTQPGVYYDTLLAAGNCDSIIQTLLLLLPAASASVDAAICFGESYFAGGANQNTSGVYYDTLIAVNGCDSIVQTTLDVFSVLISVQPDSATVLAGSAVEVTVIGGSGNLTYTWSPAQGLNCIDADCADVSIIPTGDVSYTVIAVDSFGCSDTSEIFIYVLNDTVVPNTEEPLFYVPNAFSPNGDGNNDEFKVTVSNYVSFRLLVFNRWGEKLFETNNPEVGWNGTYRGKLQNPGAYVYYVDVSFVNNIKPADYLKYNKGSVTLIR